MKQKQMIPNHLHVTMFKKTVLKEIKVRAEIA